MKTQKLNLKHYPLLAVAMGTAVEAESQVIYHDIDPDIILSLDDETFNLDINGDGGTDFKLIHRSGSYIHIGAASSYSIIVRKEMNQIYPDDPTMENIAGSTGYLFWSNTSTWFNPYAFNEAELISNDKFPGSDGIPFIAMCVRDSESSDLLGHEGNWWPDLEDHYIGVRINNGTGNFNYGWIRCSILDSAQAMVIKDYGYESELNNPILAGDTAHYTDLEEISDDITGIFAFNDEIFINLSAGSIASVRIFSLSGELVYINTLENIQNKIALKEKGLFIIEVIAKGHRFRYKIFLE